MRKNVVLPTLTAAVAVLLLMVLVRSRQPERVSHELERSPARGAVTNLVSHGAAMYSAAQKTTETSPADLRSVEQREAQRLEDVKKQVSLLRGLVAEGNEFALRQIIDHFSNPDSQIRKAAFEAAVEFGSREAVPGLQTALAATEDPHERTTIAKAMDYLNLPTLTEVRQAAGVATTMEPKTP